MDSEIRFGELEQAPRRTQLRPDRNRHFAVVPCHAPAEEDLPIYVDLDVMRDLEAHALSDLEAELGGVLLGGQYEDNAGQPFVMVADSLRAEHYENSKGSFKFTHETWSDISRKREEFPADLQMVGWYHTHPGWGVFLSGMDTFICRHFFNKPLDVALVIDPCKQERAFFQWTTDGARRTRPTRGFYMTSSRFRLAELESYAAQLEGKLPMPNDPRYSGLPSGYPPTVVQVGESKQAWMAVAVLGLLSMQFLVLALLAWRLLAPDTVATAPAGAEPSAGAEMAAERSLLDRVIGQLDVAPGGVVQELEAQRRKNEELQSSNLGLLAQVRETARSKEQTERALQAASDKNRQLQADVETLKAEQAAVRRQLSHLQERLALYEQPVEDAEADAPDAEPGIAQWLRRWNWKWYAGGIAVAALAALLAAAYASRGPTRNRDHDPNPLPDEANER